MNIIKKISAEIGGCWLFSRPQKWLSPDCCDFAHRHYEQIEIRGEKKKHSHSITKVAHLYTLCKTEDKK